MTFGEKKKSTPCDLGNCADVSVNGVTYLFVRSLNGRLSHICGHLGSSFLTEDSCCELVFAEDFGAGAPITDVCLLE